MDNTRRNPLRRAINSMTSTARNTYNRIADALSPNRRELREADRRNALLTEDERRNTLLAEDERRNALVKEAVDNLRPIITEVITAALELSSAARLMHDAASRINMKDILTSSEDEITASENDLSEYEETPNYEQTASNRSTLRTTEFISSFNNTTLNRNTNFVSRGGAMCRVEYFPYNRLDLELRPVSNRLSDVSSSSANSNEITYTKN